MNNVYCVYKHTAPDGKAYIGISKNLANRSKCHKTGKGSSKLLAEAVQQYGWDAFAHDILAFGLTKDEAEQLEVMLIATHNTMAPNGYNLNYGGGGSYEVQEKAYKVLNELTGKSYQVQYVSKYRQGGDAKTVDEMLAAVRTRRNEQKEYDKERNKRKISGVLTWMRIYDMKYDSTTLWNDIYYVEADHVRLHARLDAVEQRERARDGFTEVPEGEFR